MVAYVFKQRRMSMKKFRILIISGVLLMLILSACGSNDKNEGDNLDKIKSIDVQFKNEDVTIEKNDDIKKLYPILEVSKLEENKDYDYDSKGWIYSLVVKRDGMDDSKIVVVNENTILADGVAYDISKTDIDILKTIDEITKIDREK